MAQKPPGTRLNVVFKSVDVIPETVDVAAGTVC
jgi:hypothetical protein